MDPEYDIFELFPNGSVEWHGVVTGLDAAQANLDQLAKGSHNEFFAKYLSTNEIVARVNARNSFDCQETTPARPQALISIISGRVAKLRGYAR